MAVASLANLNQHMKKVKLKKQLLTKIEAYHGHTHEETIVDNLTVAMALTVLATKYASNANFRFKIVFISIVEAQITIASYVLNKLDSCCSYIYRGIWCSLLLLLLLMLILV